LQALLDGSSGSGEVVVRDLGEEEVVRHVPVRDVVGQVWEEGREGGREGGRVRGRSSSCSSMEGKNERTIFLKKNTHPPSLPPCLPSMPMPYSRSIVSKAPLM
jgi:hypothetical protein